MRLATGTVMVVVAAFAAGAAHAEELINLHFYVRPPYMDLGAQAQVEGLTAEPAKAAFEKAGIPFRWQQTPAKRQLVLIESGSGLDCGVGWYKTPEREKFGKFSAALHRDRPAVAIAHVKFQPRARALVEIVADPSIRVVTKVGLSYGQDVVAIMARAKAQVHSATTEQVDLARMVASDRADFMLSTYEEASILIAAVGPTAVNLRVLAFPDVQEDTTRHILCSRKVSDATMDKLNAALPKLPRSSKP